MMKPGSRRYAQFTYWNLRRKGKIQSEIARDHGISRQAVNKSVKLMERDILYRMLEFCRTSGALVEWTDAERGVTVGIITQLERIGCILLVDDSGSMRMFYDTDRIVKGKERKQVMTELQILLRDALGIEIGLKDTFKEIIEKIIEKE